MVNNLPLSGEMRASYEQNRVLPASGMAQRHIHSPLELAYDPINRFLYWSDPRNHVINVTSISGRAIGIVVQLGTRSPQSLAIDPVRGRIYWVSYFFLGNAS